MAINSIAFAVKTDRVLTDEEARDVAARWATARGYELGMTSTSRDEPWLRVSAVAESVGGIKMVDSSEVLEDELRKIGASIVEWEAVEYLSAAEVARRSRRPSIPPMVSAKDLAELAGLTVQRIYQYESDRKAGRKDDFPAPVLDGYWLRTVGEHWAKTRKSKPGPAPKPRG